MESRWLTAIVGEFFQKKCTQRRAAAPRAHWIGPEGRAAARGFSPAVAARHPKSGIPAG